jgi:hypothetical protein
MSGGYSLWRLSFLETQGAGNIQLQEVAFLNAAAADMSTGGTAGASSDLGAGYEAFNAFDKSNATQWGSAYSVFPARIWYAHPSPVDVRAVRLRYASASAMPPNADAVRLEYCWDGTRFAGGREFLLSVQSGSFTSGGVVVLAVEPRPAEPVRLLGPSGSLDMRQLNPTTGVVTDRVMFKATPSSPEQPFAQGRVWLLRAFDGFKAWEGWSDAAGYYTATGLEVGVEYVAVGMDPQRNFKATGAGPVVAVQAP